MVEERGIGQKNTTTSLTNGGESLQRRSPLGGANGNQYYLWWGIAGSSGPADSCGAGPGTIVVRDVRHHDDHRPLWAGRGRDYLPIAQATEIDGDIAGRPRNSRQAAFETDQSPVRVLRGRPGSGKTTALWRAIEARSDESVLYVTWSRRSRKGGNARQGGSTVASLAAVHDVAAQRRLLRYCAGHLPT